jgi:hypothetical protein
VTILKPRIANAVAMILGGTFIAWLLFTCAFAIAHFDSWIPALVPAAIGLLGLFWILTGTLCLIHRDKGAITIDESGISIPEGSVVRPRSSLHIPSAAITRISKSESLKDRLIEVTLATGDKVPIQARHYCELKTFLKHCAAHKLPTI